MFNFFDRVIAKKPSGSPGGVVVGEPSPPKKIGVSFFLEGAELESHCGAFEKKLLDLADSKIPEESDRKLLRRELGRIFRVIKNAGELEIQNSDEEHIQETIAGKIVESSMLNEQENNLLKSMIKFEISGEDFDVNEILERKKVAEPSGNEEEEKFLLENQGWEDQFEEALAGIIEFGGTKDEFNAQYPGVKVDHDFEFDLRVKFAEYIERSAAGERVFGKEGKDAWRKTLAAAKMINNKKIPKSFIFFDGHTFVIDDAKKAESINNSKKEKLTKEKREKFQKKAESALGNAIGVELDLKMSQIGIENASGIKVKKNGIPSEFSNAALFFMSKIVAQELFEDEVFLDRVIEVVSRGEQFSLEDEGKKRVEDLIEKSIENDEIHRAIFRWFVYSEVGKKVRGNSEIGKIISKWRKANGLDENMTSEEKRDIDQRIMLEFSDKQDVENNFVAIRSKKADAHLDAASKKNIDGIIRDFIKREFAVAEPTKDVDAEKRKKAEVEKSHEIDDAIYELHKFVDEFERKRDLISSEDSEKIEKFFEEINTTFHELHEAVFDENFKSRIIEIKKKIKTQSDELAGAAETIAAAATTSNKNTPKSEAGSEPESVINFEQHLEQGNEAVKRLVDSWAKISDFERESPEFEWLYQTLDIEGDKYFKNEFDSIKSNKKLTDEEKEIRITRKIEYLESMRERIEKIRDINQTRDELGSARRKFDEVYSQKAEVYQEVLKGLNNKSKYGELMAKDGDIAFYFKEYQKTLGKYLEDCFEKTEIQTDLLVEKIERSDLKPEAVKSWWQKFKEKIGSGFVKSKLVNEADLLKAEKIGEVEPGKIASEQKKMNDIGFEYAGGFDQLRKDLLLLMNSIMKTEKELIDLLDGKRGSKTLLRDMKIVKLMEKNNTDFAKLPKESQELLKKMFKAAELKEKDKNMTLRSFVTEIMNILKRSKSY